MSHDVVADGLCKIMNAKKARKKEVLVSYYSKLLLSILELAKKNNYIKDYFIDKEKKLRITIGELNECKAIKPRFDVQIKDIEKYVRRYLPARNFGIIIISTSKGIMTHYEALEKNLGGSLIAYFY
ncbi:MAG: 30S ribosomal protein S8 [Candidatus Pacearchaeota archaeon]